MKKITLLFTLLCANALNSMKSELPQPDTIKPKLTISDFQIYQLFSYAVKNNSELYLPEELIHAIATTACEITQEKQRRYEASCCHYFSACVHSLENLFSFITTRAKANTDKEFTIDILKACLKHSKKSLSKFKDVLNQTVLHIFMPIFCGTAVNEHQMNFCIDVLCQAADNDLIDLLCAQNNRGETVLHIAIENAHEVCVEKLIAHAGDKACELASIRNGANQTALMCAYRIYFNFSNAAPESKLCKPLREITELLESYEKTT